MRGKSLLGSLDMSHVSCPFTSADGIHGCVELHQLCSSLHDQSRQTVDSYTPYAGPRLGVGKHLTSFIQSLEISLRWTQDQWCGSSRVRTLSHLRVGGLYTTGWGAKSTGRLAISQFEKAHAMPPGGKSALSPTNLYEPTMKNLVATNGQAPILVLGQLASIRIRRDTPILAAPSALAIAR